MEAMGNSLATDKQVSFEAGNEGLAVSTNRLKNK